MSCKEEEMNKEEKLERDVAMASSKEFYDLFARQDCAEGNHIYSKSMSQEYPRKCVRCGKVENNGLDLSDEL